MATDQRTGTAGSSMSTHDDLIARLEKFASELDKYQDSYDLEAGLLREAAAALTVQQQTEPAGEGLICASCHAPWGSERCCRYWPPEPPGEGVFCASCRAPYGSGHHPGCPQQTCTAYFAQWRHP